MSDQNIDDPGMNPAGCKSGHSRKGLISNQDPDEPYDPSEPYHSISVCGGAKCQARLIKKVAGSTNRQARYYDDAERRAKKVS